MACLANIQGVIFQVSTTSLLTSAWHARPVGQQSVRSLLLASLPQHGMPALTACPLPSCRFASTDLPFIPLQTSDATEKDNLLRALTFATDPQVIQQTLQLALDPVVRPQDMATVVVGVAAKGGVSLQQSWAFLQR